MEIVTMKKAVVPFTDEELIKAYPVTNLLEGWYFRYYEISNGVYRVEGINRWGNTVSRTCADPELEATLHTCADDAREIEKQLPRR
jgi:hypothetical protein